MKENKNEPKAYEKTYLVGYEGLAMAIIRKSIFEYKLALQKLRHNPNDEKQKWKIEEIKTFFRSEWFQVLCNIEPEWLIEMIENNYNAIKYVGNKNCDLV